MQNLNFLKPDFFSPSSVQLIQASLIVAHEAKSQNRVLTNYLSSGKTHNHLDLYAATLGRQLLFFSIADFETPLDLTPINILATDREGLVASLPQALNFAGAIASLSSLFRGVMLPLLTWLVVADTYTKENPDVFFEKYLDFVASIYSRQFYFNNYSFITRISFLDPDIINTSPDMVLIMDQLKKLYPNLSLINNSFPPSPQLPTIIPPQLFQRGPYQAVDSSVIADAIYSLLVGQTLSLEKIPDSGYFASKNFSVGTVTLSIRKIDETTAQEILENGDIVKKVLHTLIAYAINDSLQKGDYLEVSGADILKFMGELYPKDKEGERRKKLEGLDWLAKTLTLLSHISVCTSLITPTGKGKANFRIEMTPLINVERVILCGETQTNIFDGNLDQISNLKIIYKPGYWFSFFHSQDKHFKNDIGYLPKQALSSKGYDFNILDWLSFKLKQHPEGDFMIQTILRETGYKTTLEELNNFYNSSRAQKLFITFNNTIETIKNLPDSYGISYRNAPEWLLDPNKKKPRGWFRDWICTTLVFTKPQILLAENSQKALPKSAKPKPKTTSQKADKPAPLTCEDLEQALKASKVSGRALSIWYAKPYNWLSKKLKEGSLTSKEIKELLNRVEFLSKNKDK